MQASIAPRAPRQIRRRAVGSLLGALLASALLMASSVQPALAASENDLAVSTDGTTFTPGNTLPLFTAMGRLVPGDNRVESVWVRNEAAIPGLLRVDMAGVTADDPDLAEGVTLSVLRHGEGDGVPVSLDQAIANGSCAVLGDGIALQPGEKVRLDLTAVVSSALVKRQGALGTVGFHLRGTLRDGAVQGLLEPGARCTADEYVPPEPDDDEDDQDGGRDDHGNPLERTGGASIVPLAMIGFLSIGGAVLFGLLAWRRRRLEQEDGETTPPMETLDERRD